jgi:hypothetical protein
MPREMKGPLSVVTAVSLVLGMGSLRLIHIPTGTWREARVA